MAHTILTSPAVRAAWHTWVPCAGMALCSWLAFVDRQVIAVLSPTIMAETGMNAQEFGRLVTFFFVAYTLGNPLWGSVLDFVGLRVGMLVAVAIWTTASASHAFMGTFFGFAMARAVLADAEADDLRLVEHRRGIAREIQLAVAVLARVFPRDVDLDVELDEGVAVHEEGPGKEAVEIGRAHV